jgi:proteasome accessory factor B
MDEALGERVSAKRDRTARLARIVAVLQANPAGLAPADVARRVGMSVRTVYRDLRAIEGDLGVPTWAEGGRWGIDQEQAFLPPLKLTLSEAMAVVLAARLMVRYADKYDPGLAAAFEKLEAVLPATLAAHVERTLAALASAPRDERFSRHLAILTRAWAEGRTVQIDYAPGQYEQGAKPRRAVVRPYLIEPSLQTHALYLIGHDETRKALRTFKIERIRDASLMPQRFAAPDPGALTEDLRVAWDIIADQPPVEVVLRFSPAVAARVGETRWHPDQRLESRGDGSLVWRAVVSGTIEIKLWVLGWGADVEVLEPADLRADVQSTLRRALAAYER